MRIRYTRPAKDRFLAAVAYIGRENRGAASRFQQEVNAKLERFKTFPNSGRKIPEFPAYPHREIIVNHYRFFYILIGQTIWIVGVWRDSQLPEEPGLG